MLTVSARQQAVSQATNRCYYSSYCMDISVEANIAASAWICTWFSEKISHNRASISFVRISEQFSLSN